VLPADFGKVARHRKPIGTDVLQTGAILRVFHGIRRHSRLSSHRGRKQLRLGHLILGGYGVARLSDPQCGAVVLIGNERAFRPVGARGRGQACADGSIATPHFYHRPIFKRQHNRLVHAGVGGDAHVCSVQVAPIVDAIQLHHQTVTQLRLALLEWQRPKIVAVEFQQVERLEDGVGGPRRRCSASNMATHRDRTPPPPRRGSDSRSTRGATCPHAAKRGAPRRIFESQPPGSSAI
jgi:hypothetical protein